MYDILLGLGTIDKFALEQDYKGNISQARNEKNLNEKSEKENKILVNWNEAIPYEEFEMKTEHLYFLD